MPWTSAPEITNQLKDSTQPKSLRLWLWQACVPTMAFTIELRNLGSNADGAQYWLAAILVFWEYGLGYILLRLIPPVAIGCVISSLALLSSGLREYAKTWKTISMERFLAGIDGPLALAWIFGHFF